VRLERRNRGSNRFENYFDDSPNKVFNLKNAYDGKGPIVGTGNSASSSSTGPVAAPVIQSAQQQQLHQSGNNHVATFPFRSSCDQYFDIPANTAKNIDIATDDDMITQGSTIEGDYIHFQHFPPHGFSFRLHCLGDPSGILVCEFGLNWFCLGSL